MDSSFLANVEKESSLSAIESDLIHSAVVDELKALQAEVLKSNAGSEIIDTLPTNLNDFSALQHKVSQFIEKLDTLQHQLSGTSQSALPTLALLRKQQDERREEEERAANGLRIGQCTLKLKKLLDEFEAKERDMRFDEAALKLVEMEGVFDRSRLSVGGDEEDDACAALERDCLALIAERRASFELQLDDLLAKCLASAPLRFTAQSMLGEGKGFAAQIVLRACAVAADSILEERGRKLGIRLCKNFVERVAQRRADERIGKRHTVQWLESHDAKNTRLVWRLEEKRLGNDEQDPKGLLGDERVLHVVRQVFQWLESSSKLLLSTKMSKGARAQCVNAVQKFVRSAVATLWQNASVLLIENVLRPTLPSSPSSLPQFLSLAEQAKDVEDLYLSSCELTTKPIREFLSVADDLYAQHRKASVLQRAREIACDREQAQLCDTLPAFERDASVVSSPSRGVLQLYNLIQSTLTEASLSTTPPRVREALVSATSDALSVHLTLSDLVNANDANFLQPLLASVDLYFSALNTSFHSQDSAVRLAVDEATRRTCAKVVAKVPHSFADSHIGSNRARLEKSLQDTALMLVESEKMGFSARKLYDHVGNALCEKLFALHDISAEECDALHQCLSSFLMELPSAPNCRSWSRLRICTTILDTKLLAIEEHYKQTWAAYLSADELKHLIRSLFAESDKRSRVLEAVK